MLARYQSSERVRTRKAPRHQSVVIDAAHFSFLTRINQQLPILVLGRLDIDSESRRRRDYAIVKRMRRSMIGIQVGIHIEQFAECYLSAYPLKIDLGWVSRADLQIRNVEVAIVAVAIASDEVGQLPLCCG